MVLKKQGLILLTLLGIFGCNSVEKATKGNVIGSLFSAEQPNQGVAGLPATHGEQIIAHEIPTRDSRYVEEIPINAPVDSAQEIAQNTKNIDSNKPININPLNKNSGNNSTQGKVAQIITNSTAKPSHDMQLITQYMQELSAKPAKYSIGDYYKFNNPDSIWAIVEIKNGLIKWQSDTGATQLTYDNPILPSIEWQSKINGVGRRFISDRTGVIFPMKKDNKYAFLTTVDSVEAGAPQPLFGKMEL